jgi:hypothetical protein
MKAVLIFLIVMQMFSPVHDDNPDLLWPSSLHQKVIVKATSLLPESIVRRILIHKNDILRGCVDTLKKGIPAGEEITLINQSYQRLVILLKSKEINFRKICYEMGRLSTYLSETSSPLRSRISPDQARIFGNFVLRQSGTFPLIITRDGEGFIRDKDLANYLYFQQSRKQQQSESLFRAMKEYPDSSTWKHQRSLQYGIASVVFNNMIMDTARIWMLAWEEAGGTVVDAPYFKAG